MSANNKVWGELVRCGGSEESAKVPTVVALTDNPTFFGRLTQPQQGGAQSFTHSSQIVIECLFISSTHFSVAKEDSEEGTVTYRIYDHSRNGTFLNGRLIGNTPQIVASGDEVALKYKDKVKIAYRFNAIAAANSQVAPSPAKVKKSDVDNATSALTQQITMLQEEIRLLEEKCAAQEVAHDTLKEELDSANRKLRQQEKANDVLTKELNDAKDRFASAEANASAVQARLIRLENELEEAHHTTKEQKSKITSLQDDVRGKSEQLGGLRKMISDSNQALAQEQASRLQTESVLRQYEDTLRQSNDKVSRLVAANEALQATIVEQDGQKARLQDHLSTHRAMIIAIQQHVEEQSRLHHSVLGKLHDMVQIFGQVDTAAQKLVQVSDKQILRDIEEFLAAPELIVPSSASAPLPMATSGTLHGVPLSGASLPFTNPVVAQSHTAVSHGTQLPSVAFGSEDSTLSKRGHFNFTQVPFSGVQDDEEVATFAPSLRVQEAIMEGDEEDEKMTQNENETHDFPSHRNTLAQEKAGPETTDDEKEEDRSSDRVHTAVAHGTSTLPPEGMLLSQDSDIRKSGSSPSKSEANVSADLHVKSQTRSQPEEEHLYTSTPATRKRHQHNSNDDDSSDSDGRGEISMEDRPRVKRLRAEETTFIADTNAMDHPSYISPPKSFDISRDLMISGSEEIDGEHMQPSEIADLREEDRQRTVDGTSTRLDISTSAIEE